METVDDLTKEETPLRSVDYERQQAIPDEIRDQQESDIEAEAPSFLEGVSLSREVDTVAISALNGIYSNNAFEPDETFEWTSDTWDSVNEGLNPQQSSRLLQARSLKEALHIQGRILREQEVEQKLGQMGWKGIGTRLLVSMFDETAIAATLASEGAALPWITASKVGTWGRLGKAALVGGTTGAGLESALAFGNENVDASDVILAASIGALTGPLAFKGIKGSEPELEEAERVLHDITQSIQADTVASYGADTAGAARATNVPKLVHDVDVNAEIARHADDVAPDYSKVRFSLTAQLKRAKTNVSKWAGTELTEDGVSGGKTSASLIAHSETERITSRYALAREDGYTAWRKEDWDQNQGAGKSRFNVLNDMEARQEFYREVSRSIRGDEVSSPAVRKTAVAIQRNNREVIQMLKSAGVEGFEEIAENDNYLTRLWSSDKMHDFNARYGEEPTIKFIDDAIRSAVPEADHLVTSKIAKAIFNRFLRSAKHPSQNFQRLFGSEALDDIEDFLDDLDLKQADRDSVETLMIHLRNKDDKASAGTKPNRAKRRVLLDESYTGHITVNGRAEPVRISDLFEENADYLHTSYIRQMMGRYALAKKGIKSDKQWQELINRHEQEWRDQGGKVSDPEYLKEVERLDFVHKSLMGQPAGDDHTSLLSNSLRLLRDTSFIQVMNQAGFSQLAELTAITSSLGFKTTLKHIPELRKMVRRMEDGSLESDHPLLRDIESAIGGFGMHRILHQPSSRYDEFGIGGYFGDSKFGKMVGKFDVAQQYMKRTTGDISGLAPITIVMHRLAATVMAEKFYQLALDPTTANMARMATLGIDDAMLKRVLKHTKKNAKSENNKLTGRKLVGMDYQKWVDEDLESFEAYKYAINRSVNRVVQNNLLGEAHPLMSTAFGKTLAQFRGFPLVGWEKQTLHNLKMMDKEAVTYALSSTALGAMAYSAQTYVGSFGRSDRQEYLDERFDTLSVAKAGFQKSGVSTLIPSIVDTVLMAGRNPFFDNHARSTGMATHVAGNPSLNTISRLGGTAKAAVGLLTNPDYELSQANIKDASVLVPFSNALGLKNLFQYMGQDLPRRSLKPE